LEHNCIKMYNKGYHFTAEQLLEELQKWDRALRTDVIVVACGGTALTIQGYKEATIDVDFLVPIPSQHKVLSNLLYRLNYRDVNGGICPPGQNWIFQLWPGQTVFVTELLDPVHEVGNHRLIRQFKHLRLGALNPDDLIISKMFRGTTVDAEDSVLLIRSENIDLSALAKRYKETAGYYYNSDNCRKGLWTLIGQMEKENLNPGPLRELYDKWT
jgi:hypothetical protein